MRGKGLLLAVELVAEEASGASGAMIPAERRAACRLLEIGVENGPLLYIRKTAGGRHGEWVMVTPRLTLSRDEVLDLFEKAIRELEAELRETGAREAALERPA